MMSGSDDARNRELASPHERYDARRRFIVGSAKSFSYASLLAFDLSAGLSHVTLIDGTVVRGVDVLSDVRSSDVMVAFSLRRYRRAIGHPPLGPASRTSASTWPPPARRPSTRRPWSRPSCTCWPPSPRPARGGPAGAS